MVDSSSAAPPIRQRMSVKKPNAEPEEPDARPSLHKGGVHDTSLTSRTASTSTETSFTTKSSSAVSISSTESNPISPSSLLGDDQSCDWKWFDNTEHKVTMYDPTTAATTTTTTTTSQAIKRSSDLSETSIDLLHRIDQQLRQLQEKFDDKQLREIQEKFEEKNKLPPQKDASHKSTTSRERQSKPRKPTKQRSLPKVDETTTTTTTNENHPPLGEKPRLQRKSTTKQPRHEESATTPDAKERRRRRSNKPSKKPRRRSSGDEEKPRRRSSNEENPRRRSFTGTEEKPRRRSSNGNEEKPRRRSSNGNEEKRQRSATPNTKKKACPLDDPVHIIPASPTASQTGEEALKGGETDPYSWWNIEDDFDFSKEKSDFQQTTTTTGNPTSNHARHERTTEPRPRDRRSRSGSRRTRRRTVPFVDSSTSLSLSSKSEHRGSSRRTTTTMSEDASVLSKSEHHRGPSTTRRTKRFRKGGNSNPRLEDLNEPSFGKSPRQAAATITAMNESWNSSTLSGWYSPLPHGSVKKTRQDKLHSSLQAPDLSASHTSFASFHSADHSARTSNSAPSAISTNRRKTYRRNNLLDHSIHSTTSSTIHSGRNRSCRSRPSPSRRRRNRSASLGKTRRPTAATTTTDSTHTEDTTIDKSTNSSMNHKTPTKNNKELVSESLMNILERSKQQSSPLQRLALAMLLVDEQSVQMTEEDLAKISPDQLDGSKVDLNIQW